MDVTSHSFKRPENNGREPYRISAIDTLLMFAASVPFGLMVWYMTSSWIVAIGAAVSGLLAGVIVCIAARWTRTNQSHPPALHADANVKERSPWVMIVASLLAMLIAVGVFASKHSLIDGFFLALWWIGSLLAFCVLVPRLPRQRAPRHTNQP